MLKINRKLSKRGFSLIELMVAVAILAMVSLGIFKAYTTSFQGMVNSRERTIANNIAQKILEEVKSKNLEVGYSASLEPETISGKEFTAIIDIEEGPDPSITTLNKAIATVKWKDRNNKDKEITLETLVNTYYQKPETDVPTYILLSINPTSLILNEDSAQITVTILDQDRYPINFNGQINLSVVPDLGSFSPTILSFSSQTNQTATFTPMATGEAQIEATDNANNLYSDSKTIEITLKPEIIRLTADSAVILKDTGQSIVTIKILDSENNLVEFSGTVTITTLPEVISATLSCAETMTIEFSNEDTKTFNLFAGEEAEEITIKANAQYEGEDLQEGSTTVRVSNGPDHLLLYSDRESIQNNGEDTAVLTVTVADIDEYPITYTSSDPVTLSINSSDPSGIDGAFDPANLTFTGENALNSNFSTSSSAGKVFIIANNSELGNSNIVEISVTTGPPKKLEVVANPKTIVADGQSTSKITITAKDDNNYETALGSPGTPVIVTISLSPENGSIVGGNSLTFTGQLSQEVTYISSTVPDTVTITASSSGLVSGSDEITITAGRPAKIHLSAIPLSITNDGDDESTITITILDENDNATPYTGDIRLSLYPLDGGEIDITEAQISKISTGLYEISFNAETVIPCFFTSTHEDDVDVEITASDPSGELDPSNSVTITVTFKIKKDFKVIHGNSVIQSGNRILTLTNGVDYTLEPGVITEDCFVRIVNTRITGIGRTSGGDDQNLDDYTVQISNPENILTSFNFERVGSPSYSRDCRVTWEIIQYIGAEGGANEIKVRTAVGGLSTTAISVNGPSLSNISNKNKAVIYITGQSGSNTGTGEWNECLFTSEFIASGSNWIPRFSRGRAIDTGRVSYAVVEFTGSNWRNIQRITFNSCGSTVTIPIPLLYTTKTFLHCQYTYVKSADSGLDDSGETVEVLSTTQLTSRRRTSTDASSKYHVVWVMENTQSNGNYMIVQHISGTRIDNVAPEEHVWSEAIYEVRALDEASIQGETLASYGSDTAYPIGSEGLIITSTTNLNRIQSDMGQDCDYAHCIVQFPTEE